MNIYLYSEILHCTLSQRRCCYIAFGNSQLALSEFSNCCLLKGPKSWRNTAVKICYENSHENISDRNMYSLAYTIMWLMAVLCWTILVFNKKNGFPGPEMRSEWTVNKDLILYLLRHLDKVCWGVWRCPLVQLLHLADIPGLWQFHLGPHSSSPKLRSTNMFDWHNSPLKEYHLRLFLEVQILLGKYWQILQCCRLLPTTYILRLMAFLRNLLRRLLMLYFKINHNTIPQISY